MPVKVFTEHKCLRLLSVRAGYRADAAFYTFVVRVTTSEVAANRLPYHRGEN